MLKWLSEYVHQSWVIVGFCIGIILGMVMGMIVRISYFSSSMWLVFCIVSLIFVILCSRRIFIILIVIVGMILAFFRISAESKYEDYIKQFIGQEVSVVGVVSGDPETDESGTKVKLANLKFGEEQVVARGNIYALIKQNEKIARSDQIAVKGKLVDGFGTYVGYMYKPNVIEINRPEPGDWVLRIRNWFAGRIKNIISEPQVNLGLSYLLGMKSSLPDDLSWNLRMVGLVHIVVASGAHLSILVETARKIFGKMSRFSGLLFSLLFVVFFMAMVGWTPSILRAGIMTILSLITWYVGRKISPWRIILLVAAFTLLLNPMFIVDLGWLLSFASFTGIMILGPRIINFFYGDKELGFIANVIITTISATIMTLPIILYFYGQLSLISVVANLLILPTLPYAMGLMFLSGVVEGVPVIESIIGWCTTKILDFHITIVDFFGQQKSFIVNIGKDDMKVFIIYIFVLAPIIIGSFIELRIKKNKRGIIELVDKNSKGLL